jgi:hypothetical protein
VGLAEENQGPPRKELRTRFRERAAGSALTARLEVLELELEKLRREMGRNSGNSDKPPSSDTVTQQAE